MLEPQLDEQEVVLAQLNEWLESSDTSPRVLSGGAGVGKTHCLKALSARRRGRIVFTATTNKAVRVLRTALTTDEFKPECLTIYSLLGLRLEPNGEVKELTTPENPIDISKYLMIAVDEAGMANEMLERFIQLAAQQYGVRVLYIGDPCQLPPVKEKTSPIWQHKTLTLTKVRRFDNQILKLATHLRACVEGPFKKIDLQADNDGTEGVWKLGYDAFVQKIQQAAAKGLFQVPDRIKVIAWRNVTVDKYNALIRAAIFGEQARTTWLPTDRVIFTSPAKDIDKQPLASTDDEGTVERVAEAWHPDYGDMKVLKITINLDDNRVVTAITLHPASVAEYTRRLSEYAELATADRRRWRHYWEFKDAFHQLRHSYAITAHRSQGSTYNSVFVDWGDILRNPETVEARKCLYVACSRPQKVLVLGNGV